MVRSARSKMFMLAAILLTVPLICLPAHAADTCKVAHDAYNKMLKAAPKLIQKDTGAVRVTQALGVITAGDWDETCKYLRDDSVEGEAALVYSDNFASKGARVDGQVWISQKTGLVIRQEGDADLGPKGKGHQSIRFDYKK